MNDNSHITTETTPISKQIEVRNTYNNYNKDLEEIKKLIDKDVKKAEKIADKDKRMSKKDEIISAYKKEIERLEAKKYELKANYPFLKDVKESVNDVKLAIYEAYEDNKITEEQKKKLFEILAKKL